MAKYFASSNMYSSKWVGNGVPSLHFSRSSAPAPIKVKIVVL